MGDTLPPSQEGHALEGVSRHGRAAPVCRPPTRGRPVDYDVRDPAFPSRKVALGERPARARLEVVLKPHGFSFALKFQRHDKRPRPMQNGMSRRTVVVPVQTLAHVAGDSGVMTRGFCVTADDVDETLVDAVHAKGTGTDRTSVFLEEFLESRFDSTQFERFQPALGSQETQGGSALAAHAAMARQPSPTSVTRLPSRSSLVVRNRH